MPWVVAVVDGAANGSSGGPLPVIAVRPYESFPVRRIVALGVVELDAGAIVNDAAPPPAGELA